MEEGKFVVLEEMRGHYAAVAKRETGRQGREP
jgi:hypothetical protein